MMKLVPGSTFESIEENFNAFDEVIRCVEFEMKMAHPNVSTSNIRQKTRDKQYLHLICHSVKRRGDSGNTSMMMPPLMPGYIPSNMPSPTDSISSIPVTCTFHVKAKNEKIVNADGSIVYNKSRATISSCDLMHTCQLLCSTSEGDAVPIQRKRQMKTKLSKKALLDSPTNSCNNNNNNNMKFLSTSLPAFPMAFIPDFMLAQMLPDFTTDPSAFHLGRGHTSSMSDDSLCMPSHVDKRNRHASL